MSSVSFDHVAVACWDQDRVAIFVEAEMGGSRLSCSSQGSQTPMRVSQFNLGKRVKLELISPARAEAPSFISKFLTKRGPALHHVTFRVGSSPSHLQAVLRRAHDLGLKTSDLRYHPYGDSWCEVFLSPRTAPIGLLVQIVVFDRDDPIDHAVTVQALRDWHARRPPATARREAVTLEAVCLARTSVAERIFGELLEGERRAPDSFHWDKSPLCIRLFAGLETPVIAAPEQPFPPLSGFTHNFVVSPAAKL